MVRPRLWAILSCAACLSLVPSPTRATNGTHKRTPVLWDGEAACGTTDDDLVCGIVVDRSTQTSLHVPYGIPYEDTDVSMDEVGDSRRHQLFALCRQRAPALGSLPNWITDADVQAASEVIVCTTPMDEGPEECGPLVDPASVDPEDVLETSTSWQGCWHRINADDARRPITCAMAEDGLDWALAGVPAGAYVVEGYTWEPAFNLWSQRPGFLKVVDDPEDAQQDVPVAAILVEGDGIIYTGEVAQLSACVDAQPGSTVRGDWAIVPNGGGEPQWQELMPAVPVEDGPLSVDFEPPEESAGEFVVLRLVVEDPMDRTWIAYTPRELGVLPGTGCPEEDSGGIVVPPGCEETDSGGSTGAGTSTDGSSGAGEGAASDDAPGAGCGCRAPGERGGVTLPLGGVWLALRRRRKSADG